MTWGSNSPSWVRIPPSPPLVILKHVNILVDIHKKTTGGYYTEPMETYSTNYKYCMLFGGEPVSASEKDRVLEEVEKVGSLTFGLSFTTEGWTAQCNEIPSI